MESLERAREYKTHPLKKHGSISTPFQLMEMFRLLWNAGLMLLIVRMMLCSASMACSEGSNTGDHDRNGMKERYEKWLTRHGRSYKDREEWQLRFGIYQSNVQFIDFFNSLNYSHQLVDNKFSDMTNAEFKRIYLRYHHSKHKKTHFRYEGEKGLPTTVDWRKKGAVTPVKDQGQCGSCWAFSSVAAVEGIHKIKNGELVSLSEQELMDCDVTSDNNGCNGGYMDKAFAFIKNIGGITTEKEYPYRGSRGTCNKSKMKSVAAKISGYERVPANEETSLQAAVSHQPVSVAIDAGGYAFQFYSRGIFTGVCGDSLNHGVAAVGYGEEGGSKYWLVKNSWGADWGESGYIRMKRGSGKSHGTCGIAMEASYPV